MFTTLFRPFPVFYGRLCAGFVCVGATELRGDRAASAQARYDSGDVKGGGGSRFER